MSHNCKTCNGTMDSIIFGEWKCLICYPNLKGERQDKYFKKPLVHTTLDSWRTVSVRTIEERDAIIENIHSAYILKPAALELR